MCQSVREIPSGSEDTELSSDDNRDEIVVADKRRRQQGPSRPQEHSGEQTGKSSKRKKQYKWRPGRMH